MAYDEGLAERVREVIATRAEADEIKMFGGLCFMVNTHMAVGVTGEACCSRSARSTSRTPSPAAAADTSQSSCRRTAC